MGTSVMRVRVGRNRRQMTRRWGRRGGDWITGRLTGLSALWRVVTAYSRYIRRSTGQGLLKAKIKHLLKKFYGMEKIIFLKKYRIF